MAPVNRRDMMSTSLTGLTGAGIAGLALSQTATATAAPTPTPETQNVIIPAVTNSGDQTTAIQAALDQAGQHGGGHVQLGVGTFEISSLQLPANTTLAGITGATTLLVTSAASGLSCQDHANITIDQLTIDQQLTGAIGIDAQNARNFNIKNTTLRNVRDTAIKLEACSGWISNCQISDIGNVGIFANNSSNLHIADTTITGCGNNGIQIWQSAPAHDGTLLIGNRISKIAVKSGGTGQNGNGINIFRANNVQVHANQISECGYSAIRGNAASNIQIIANTCRGLGEVAIYAEFTFEGALISNNVIDQSATGIAVTNSSVGGRLAVVQGNLIRNLRRRENEPVDKRGVGISVEADTSVTGNTIENAATAGIRIGHRQHMRDCAVTGNVIRNARNGILVSSNKNAGACLVANNLVSGATDGAIKGHDGIKPVGADLAGQTTLTDRISISGNLAV
ncbi:MAG: TIGR03808 family TAT-translocated repetitive protein [Pseudomonadota bacterium]